MLGLTPDQALAYGRRVDHARRDYVRSFFEADIDDAGAYDLVLNMERFTTESAADLLVAVLRSRGWIGGGNASCVEVLQGAAEGV